MGAKAGDTEKAKLQSRELSADLKEIQQACGLRHKTTVRPDEEDSPIFMDSWTSFRISFILLTTRVNLVVPQSTRQSKLVTPV